MIQNFAIYVCQKKVSLICTDPDSLWNKSSELNSKYRYRNKFSLGNVKKQLPLCGF